MILYKTTQHFTNREIQNSDLGSFFTKKILSPSETKKINQIQNVHHLDSKIAIDLLKVCLESSIDDTLKKILEQRLHEITWYEDVSVYTKCG